MSSIRHARDAFVSGDLRSRLERYHGGNVDEAFWLWNNAWLAPGFEPMDAGIRLPRVRVPVLALQGEHDEYGTLLQLRRVSRGVSGRCETRLLSDCGHGPHLQDEATTVEVIARFVSTLWRGPAATAAPDRLGAMALAACSPARAGSRRTTVSCEPAEVRHDLAAGGLRRTADGWMMPPPGRCCSRPSGWRRTCRELAIASRCPGRVARSAAPGLGGRRAQSAWRHQSGVEAPRGAARFLALPLAHRRSWRDTPKRCCARRWRPRRTSATRCRSTSRSAAISPTSLAPGAQTRLWPLPIDEVEGELWLEVDRFTEARAAFERCRRRRPRRARDDRSGADRGSPEGGAGGVCRLPPCATTAWRAPRPTGAPGGRPPEWPARVALTRMPRYRPEVLDELGRHGLAPRCRHPPPRLREQINDLYRIEIRKLRDRCRAGEIPVRELPAHVVELRKRYLLLSIPMENWVEPADCQESVLHCPDEADYAPVSPSVYPGRRAPPGDVGRSVAEGGGRACGPPTTPTAARRSACSAVRRAPTR